MRSFARLSLPIRNTILILLLATLFETGMRLWYKGPTSELFAMKRLSGFLILGWAIVDFFELGQRLLPKQAVSKKVAGEKENSHH